MAMIESISAHLLEDIQAGNYIELDDNKFMQCINNLVSNALKFTPDGGEITISVEHEKNLVLFKVADNGIGIPAKLPNTLFDKFTNARRSGIKGEFFGGPGYVHHQADCGIAQGRNLV